MADPPARTVSLHIAIMIDAYGQMGVSCNRARLVPAIATGTYEPRVYEMFCISSRSHINVDTDSFNTALLRKADNQTLSNKTLEKLARVANSSYGLSMADARNLFVYSQAIGKSDASQQLCKELSTLLVSVSNEKVKVAINSWIGACRPVNNFTVVSDNATERRVPVAYFVEHDLEKDSSGCVCATNMSLTDSNNEVIASGRCSVQAHPGGAFLYISGLYVEGNSSPPSPAQPNRYAGLGRALMYESMKFGHENNIKTALLVPLEGSEGFYRKMGFVPEREANLAAGNSESVLADNGWHGNVAKIFAELGKQELVAWKIG